MRHNEVKTMILSDVDFNVLKNADIFSSADEALLRNALTDSDIEKISYKKGEIIYSSEVFHDCIGIIISGKASVSKKDGDVIVNRLSDGDIFGAAALFLSREYFINVITAMVKTQVIYVGKAAIRQLMQLDSGFSLGFIRYLSERIFFLNKRIVSFTGGTAESRVARFLLSSLGDYKVFEIDRPMSQLAVSLDIGRASLYRAFDKLTESGAIEKNGKLIRLVNKETLVSFIE
ncbi:MAG: Crp/Fnr family transcriptional regulator [Acutalibacteraceae bacterium]